MNWVSSLVWRARGRCGALVWYVAVLTHPHAASADAIAPNNTARASASPVPVGQVADQGAVAGPSQPALDVPKLSTSASGLSRRRAEELAKAFSLSVRARRAQLDQADALVAEARAEYLGDLDLSASATKLRPVDPTGAGFVNVVIADPSLPDGTLNPSPTVARTVDLSNTPINHFYKLSANLRLPLSEYLTRIAPAYRGARYARTAAEYELEGARRESAADAAELYYQWLFSRECIQSVIELLNQHRAHAESVRAHVQAGLSSNEELNLADTDEFDLRSQLVQAVRQEAHIRAALRVAIGADVNAQLVPSETLPADAAPITRPLASLVQSALRYAADLQSAAASAHSDRERAQAALAEGLPRLEALGNLIYSDPGIRPVQQIDEWQWSWSVGIALNWSPTNTPRGVSESDRLKAHAKEVEANARLAGQKLALDVESSYNDVGADLATLQLGRARLRAAEAGYENTVESYRRNTGTALAVSHSLSQLVQANKGLLTGRVNLALALSRLRHLTGLAEL